MSNNTLTSATLSLSPRSIPYAREIARLRQESMHTQLNSVNKIKTLETQLRASEEDITEQNATIDSLRTQLAQELISNNELCSKYQLYAYRTNRVETSAQISEADVRDLQARLNSSKQRIQGLEDKLLNAYRYIEYSRRIDRERITAYETRLLLAKHDAQLDTAMGSFLTALLLKGPLVALVTAAIANTVHQTSNSCTKLPSRVVLQQQLKTSQTIIDHLRVAQEVLDLPKKKTAQDSRR